jgi:hypothetical protein
VSADDRAVPDLGELRLGIEESLAELSSLAGARA